MELKTFKKIQKRNQLLKKKFDDLKRQFEALYEELFKEKLKKITLEYMEKEKMLKEKLGQKMEDINILIEKAIGDVVKGDGEKKNL